MRRFFSALVLLVLVGLAQPVSARTFVICGDPVIPGGMPETQVRAMGMESKKLDKPLSVANMRARSGWIGAGTIPLYDKNGQPVYLVGRREGNTWVAYWVKNCGNEIAKTPVVTFAAPAPSTSGVIIPPPQASPRPAVLSPPPSPVTAPMGYTPPGRPQYLQSQAVLGTVTLVRLQPINITNVNTANGGEGGQGGAGGNASTGPITNTNTNINVNQNLNQVVVPIGIGTGQ